MASGDLKYKDFQLGTLTAGQKTDLASLLSAVWSGSLADLQLVVFTRNPDNSVRYELIFDRAVVPSALPIGSVVTGRVP